MHKQYYIEQKKSRKADQQKKSKKQISITEFMIVTSIRYLQESLHRYTGDMI